MYLNKISFSQTATAYKSGFLYLIYFSSLKNTGNTAMHREEKAKLFGLVSKQYRTSNNVFLFSFYFKFRIKCVLTLLRSLLVQINIQYTK